MNLLVASMKGILIVAGLLTMTMVYFAVAPVPALQGLFGPTIANFGGPIVEVVARGWGALIALVGGMLLFSAFHVPSRPLALTVASLSKLYFVVSMLIYARDHLVGQALVAAVFDSILIVLFATYLVATRQGARGDR